MTTYNKYLNVMLLFCIYAIIYACCQNSGFTPKQIQQMTVEHQHKFPISIDTQFSSSSDMTIVVVSCNRLAQLQVTINSFFHYNTHTLNQFIIIEDCWNPETQLEQYKGQLYDILPFGAEAYPQYFHIIINDHKQKMGQIGSIDKAYRQVKTRYVYYLEDDWAQYAGYGFLERMKDVLIHYQGTQKKVSQVVQTIPNWLWNHYRGPLQRTSHHTNYYQVTSYGKQWLYHFSFNPHLFDFEELYVNTLNRSLIKTIAQKYHCVKQMNAIYMESGGCVQQYLGRFLNERGYKQLSMETSQNVNFKHIGLPQYQKPEIYQFQVKISNLDDLIQEQQKQQEKKSSGVQNKGSQTLHIKPKQKILSIWLWVAVIIIVFLIIIILSSYYDCTETTKKTKKQRFKVNSADQTESQSTKLI